MISQKSKRNGLIGSCICIVYYLAIGLFSPRLLFHPILSFFPVIVYFGLMANTGRSYVNQAEEFSFRNCFANIWITGAIIAIMTSIFLYFLYNTIVPNLHELEYEMMVQRLQKMGDLLGEERMEETLEQVRAEDFKKTPKVILQSTAIGLVLIVGILALLISGVLSYMNKKRQKGNYGESAD